ncbi:helix-turn-helix domain-containing protein [Porphyromonas levii]|uniref:DNA-binding protein n=1 Tax=Porphyromonas levii TaxID=28114 RepID=A0A4Y8WMD8_9PORP|nr:helix-turn-helix domain-containing protein [Porphyromonas levii]MBR8703329.1 hypothetical protein [Porphyromonas levii]MBR8730357.1 hypothetical protein [Porphyromonas levii]MBR8764125.1 hypothetical protein [Porphyromonas levii]MBR8766479.1 hypothetical protein [Porphyromonas levii]MBR8770409.1 hypothetical protein [Porphyromonas levii]
MDNEIITRDDPRFRLFLQLMESLLQKLEVYCQTTKPLFNGEQYLTSEEVCEMLHISPRTLQEYRSSGLLPFYKLAGRSKALFKLSDIQKVLEEHYYNPNK